MLYVDGKDEEEARAYLERWALLDRELSAHAIRFLRGATARAYIICYSAGRELCEAYVADDPARFRRLLSEQLRVGDLLV
jgi:hypothetical protein